MIVLYKGSIGRGKTLCMVKDAYKFYLAGYHILSNIKLPFGEYITSDEVLDLSRFSKLYNCVLVLDELQLFFDSRNFSKQENKSFSYFIQQVRKRNIIILGTTQYVNTVELRFRQHISHVAEPKYDKNSNVCGTKYYDLTLLEDNINIPKPSVVCFDAKQVFNLFNTYEMLR